jgi:hypothetical protein
VGAPVFGYKDSDNYATYEENGIEPDLLTRINSIMLTKQ